MGVSERAVYKKEGLDDPSCGVFFWGARYPNLKSVRELIYKRGFGKVDRRRIPLTDNAIIESVSSLKLVAVETLLDVDTLNLFCPNRTPL